MDTKYFIFNEIKDEYDLWMQLSAELAGCAITKYIHNPFIVKSVKSR